MIKFVVVVPHPEQSRDCYLTNSCSWPVLPRIDEKVCLSGFIEGKVDEVRHDFVVDEEHPHIEIIVSLTKEDFFSLCEVKGKGWEKTGFD